MQAAEGKQLLKVGSGQNRESPLHGADASEDKEIDPAFGYCVEKHHAQNQGRDSDNSQQGDRAMAHP